jgi:predicted DNA-binding transcriptional regulator AlpA
MSHEIYLSAQEVADRMGIKLGTVYRRRSDFLPMPPAVKFGRKLVWRESVVDAFMLQYEETAA